MSAERDALLSERVLNSMRDGVMAIDLTGRIIMFNEAAGEILGKDPAGVIGQPFAEEFLMDERFDDFNELVLKAVYEAETVHSTEIVLKDGQERTDLHVSSSFLMRERDGEGAVDPEGEQRFGVVVVFSNVTEQRKRRKLKRLFGEYVDPRIVEEILSRGADTRSRRGDMTISFVDMRDFTGWSERLGADAMTALLNRFLTAVTKPIGEAGSITDKYIGDAAMACWGPPFTDAATQAADACRAALGQIAAVAVLREELLAEGMPGAERFDAAVGVATGDVLAGDIGPPSARNFTVIGNAVNLAARLQDTAKTYGQHVLISEETRERAGEAFVYREIDRITVRGSVRPVKIYAVLGEAGTVDGATLALARDYEAALADLHARAFERAHEALVALVERAPGDKSARYLLERAAELVVNPPPEDWDGTWHLGPAAGAQVV